MSDNPFLPPSSNLSARESFGTTPVVSEAVLDGLRRTKGWVRFSGILMVLMFGLQVLNLILVSAGMAATGMRGSSQAVMLGTGAVGIFFGVLLFLWPALRLLKYSRMIGYLLEKKTAAELEQALDAQRGFWKHVGIIVLIYLIFIVGMLVLVLGGLALPMIGRG